MGDVVRVKLTENIIVLDDDGKEHVIIKDKYILVHEDELLWVNGIINTAS